MKHAMLLLFAVSFSGYSMQSLAQNDSFKSGNGKQTMVISDSLNYMNELVASKQKYINQPLSILLADLKMPIQSYYGLHGSERFKNSGLWLYFDASFDTSTRIRDSRGRNEVAIIIEWTTSLVRSDIEAHLSREAGQWTAAEQQYSKNEIIRDIAVPFRRQ